MRARTLRTVRGTVQADILKEDQGQNTCIFSTEFSLRVMADMQEWFIANSVRNFYSVSISGYHIAEAGANPISQLAFTLANGFTYVEAYLARGMDIDDFAPNFSFFFSNGMDPEYTVIGRVARRIWAIVMRDRYGANPRSQKLKYHVQTSGRSLHAQEMAFNDIRTTLQALCAIYDNANSLHTNAYDEAVTTPTTESVRRALAIQMIINQEWGLARNENPLQGSFVVEQLTDLVEEAVLAELERLSDRGGVLGAMETGYQRGRIQDESMLYEQKKHDGSLPIIGVNTFRNPVGEEVPEPTWSWPGRPRTRSRASCAGWREFHAAHADDRPASLARLQEAALVGGQRVRCADGRRAGAAAWARSPTPCSRSAVATGATSELVYWSRLYGWKKTTPGWLPAWPTRPAGCCSGSGPTRGLEPVRISAATVTRPATNSCSTRLAAERPADAVLSEESVDDPVRLDADRVWIIDPLDGTREFTMAGRTDWAVHVALWETGKGITAAAVALPAAGRVFCTDPPPAPPGPTGRDRPLILVSDTRPPAFVDGVATALGADVAPMGSAGAKTMAVVTGDADAYVHAGGQWEWDSAAPVGVALAAGLHASRIDGAPLQYNQPHPYLPDLVVSAAPLAADLLAALAAQLRKHAAGPAVDGRHALVAMDAEGFGGLALLHLLHQVRLPQQGAGHGHQREAEVDGPFDRVQAVDAAQQDERHVERLAELTGVREEERLFEGVRRHKAAPDQLEPGPHGRRQGGAELLQWRLTAEEVHGVGQRTAAGQLQRIEVTVGFEHPAHLHALVQPQATRHTVGHVELGR